MFITACIEKHCTAPGHKNQPITMQKFSLYSCCFVNVILLCGTCACCTHPSEL